MEVQIDLPNARRRTTTFAGRVAWSDGAGEAGGRAGDAALDLNLAPYESRPGVLLLSGSFSYDYEAECAYCLEPVRVEVRGRFRTILDLARNVVEALDLESGEEPATFRRVDEDRIDVAEEIASRLAQALPDRVLCRPDCRGLCPTCGANKNTAPCSHEASIRTPTWTIRSDHHATSET